MGWINRGEIEKATQSIAQKAGEGAEKAMEISKKAKETIEGGCFKI
ncbi:MULTISPECIES: hypothetical protein [Clostridium]|nr:MULTISPECIES: hypothetical protein [Clostridium]